MSSSPGGTVPATSSVSQSALCKPAVSQTTCFAGPPTLSRAMMRTIFISGGAGMPGLSSTRRTGTGFLLQLHFVCARLRDQVRRQQQTLERTGVGPPAVKLIPGHLAAVDVRVVDVGDFQLAAARRL